MSKAYEANLQKSTFEANADLSSYQYYGVIMNTSEKIALASGAEKILGVLQDTPDDTDRPCIVAFGGITKAIGAAAISAGHEVEVDSAGKFVPQTSGVSVGFAVVACGGNGQHFSLLLNQT